MVGRLNRLLPHEIVARARDIELVRAKKSKLRPRKAPITITPTAVSHLRELLEQPESKLVRVGVKNRGCSGLAYHLEYVDKAGAFDEAVQQDGVQVLIDSKALFSIIGSEMDWVEGHARGVTVDVVEGEGDVVDQLAHEAHERRRGQRELSSHGGQIPW